ncbi:hypothetical protein [Candidatus Poriferisodalis sp.]|uniref:hypothetical protein n=1 Tax=Candidatus Poriferisodalis sp. TaxID=3101277 RepID=UPI003B524051
MRSQPQGHEDYRRVVTAMYRQIAEVAGHSAVAAMMSHIDLSEGVLGRLGAEKATMARRSAEPA